MESVLDFLAESALRSGLRFDRFSHWPAAWHPIVMRVVHEAVRLGIPRLYIKVKLGGLRIQGGDERIAKAVVDAEAMADRTCISCGEGCAPQKAPDYPLCAVCNGIQLRGAIHWVAPLRIDRDLEKKKSLR